jgi:anion-transporting  ArsA/GET3 family ATPase
MFEGLKARSQRVMALMVEPTTTFLLICAPEPVSLRQADRFVSRLAGDRMNVSGILVNRVHTDFGDEELTAADIQRLDQISSPAPASHSLSERVDAALQDARALAAADTKALALLAAVEQPRRYVPHLNRDLHNLADLREFAQQLQ